MNFNVCSPFKYKIEFESYILFKSNLEKKCHTITPRPISLKNLKELLIFYLDLNAKILYR